MKWTIYNIYAMQSVDLNKYYTQRIYLRAIE